MSLAFTQTPTSADLLKHILLDGTLGSVMGTVSDIIFKDVLNSLFTHAEDPVFMVVGMAGAVVAQLFMLLSGGYVVSKQLYQLMPTTDPTQGFLMLLAMWESSPNLRTNFRALMRLFHMQISNFTSNLLAPPTVKPSLSNAKVDDSRRKRPKTH